MPSTISELLQAGDDDSIAISGIDRPHLSYAALRDVVADTEKTLNSLGIGRNDRVAIVLPNGPEMATSFVAIAACGPTDETPVDARIAIGPIDIDQHVMHAKNRR